VRIALKILAAPMIVLGLTAFGLSATCLALRSPSPTAIIGPAEDSSAGFAPLDGAPLWK
jgi:hypothetical protein